MKILNWIRKFFTSRFFLILTILLIQIFLMFMGFGYLNDYPILKYGFQVLNLIITIYVVNRDVNTSYKLVWILLIYAIPVAGSLVYLLFAERRVPKAFRLEMIKSLHETEDILKQKKGINKLFKDSSIKQEYDYVLNNAYYPYYNNTDIKYLSSGEVFFEELLSEIEKAEKFVFLEFFIVKKGQMLNRLVKLLKNKVANGVKVYLMYDDVGTMTSLPANMENELRDYGINCLVFNKASIFLSLLSKTNNRDHRKICVIDNKVGFMGGLNIGDEYINVVERFGYWKDSGIKLIGEAVSSLTIMFIQFYNASGNNDLVYDDFLIDNTNLVKNDSLVLPFSDSPTDEEEVGRTVHLNMISKASKYLYIQTPYLILDYNMREALKIARKNGVEVIITVPHIPDKKTVFMVTRSNYIPLLKAGVRIFEYSPGFIHSKMFVSDDKIALQGTINMDFRSYYLHYECGTLIAYSKEIEKMKEDYLNTLKESKEITLEEAMKTNIIIRLFRSIMNVFSPIL